MTTFHLIGAIGLRQIKKVGNNVSINVSQLPLMRDSSSREHTHLSNSEFRMPFDNKFNFLFTLCQNIMLLASQNNNSSL